ncbi:aldo/keto reductase [Streptomyces sp. NBC_00365]|uniref:aldo/keto reductase n=1 Tax=Streptomyces sp. NBC_00365 TaxID=2975726 RepID=UPI0022509874|nr:aldo/keto reductase [Streptomyces sp. NBC_00365]MCX5096196.1 aldo/keto reductase [Streptomyces sp. NBC_00365]
MSPRTNTAAATSTWQLGDLTVNRVGFGAIRLTGTAPFDRGVPRDRKRSIGLLRRAVELGVNHIDTAAFYFSATRSANELINRALAPYPQDLIITTKVWPGRDPSGAWWWAAPAQLRGQVEENLRQLGRDHLDVVNLRVPPSRRTGSIGEHFGALAELRDAGLIRHLGISNVTSEQLAEALAIAPVVCVQNPYGIGALSEDPGPRRSREMSGLCSAVMRGELAADSTGVASHVSLPPAWPSSRLDEGDLPTELLVSGASKDHGHEVVQLARVVR